MNEDNFAWEEAFKTTQYCANCSKEEVCKYCETFNKKLSEVDDVLDVPETNWFMSSEIRCKFFSKKILNNR